jgi:hypothetical protein
MDSPKFETDVKLDYLTAMTIREIRHLKLLIAAWAVTVNIAYYVLFDSPCANSGAGIPHGCQQPHVATNCGTAVPGPAPSVAE